MTTLRSFPLALFLLAFATVPACILRRGDLAVGETRNDAGLDAPRSEDDARVDVGGLVRGDAGPDAYITLGEDAPLPDAHVCGAAGQACCGGGCGPWLDCVADSCLSCGETGQACCGGTTCLAGLVCNGGGCARCGGEGEACCPDGCDGGLTCTDDVCTRESTTCDRAGAACCTAIGFIPYCENAAGVRCMGSTCVECGRYDQQCCPAGCLGSLSCVDTGFFNYRCR